MTLAYLKTNEYLLMLMMFVRLKEMRLILSLEVALRWLYVKI